MKVKCGYCGKELDRTPHRVKRSQHHFCCKQCYNLWRIGKPHPQTRYRIKLFICEYCEKQFEQYDSQIGHNAHHFCSRACYSKFRSKKTRQICSFCGKEFQRKLSASLMSKRHFCSQECYFKFHKQNQPTTKCSYCGQELSLSQYYLSRHERHFCGLECRDNFMVKKIWLICEYCGKEFERCPSQAEGKEHVFCSMQCRGRWQAEHWTGENNPAWKGGYEPYYGPNWKQQRYRARQRDDFCCKLCGISEAELGRELDVHHTYPFRHFGLAQYEVANSLANLVSVCSPHHSELECLIPKEQIMRLRSKSPNTTF